MYNYAILILSGIVLFARTVPGQPLNDYVIITTSQISAQLQVLPEFTQHLERLGFTPLIVTESDFGSCQGPPPNGTAEKIRTWLKTYYLGLAIQYVLLIGDPDPDDTADPYDRVGDIPMKMCWPGGAAATSGAVPTDYYYAELTGRWDFDGDCYYGEREDDGPGMDFVPEVYVGRIPLYEGDQAAVDSILRKTIRYREGATDLAWRKKVLLGMPLVFSSIDEWNVSEFPRHLIEQCLLPAGFTPYVLYEKEGLAPVAGTGIYDNPDRAGINTVNFLGEWQKQYGCVIWNAHGDSSGVFRTYWYDDPDSNGLASAGEIRWAPFFTSQDVAGLDDEHPSVVYALACNNGYPEYRHNLAGALLKQGAVAVVAASRASYGASYNTGGAALGYVFLERVLVYNDPVGKALYQAKTYGTDNWNNKLGYNLYGVPDLCLQRVVEFTETASCCVEADRTVVLEVVLSGGGPGQARVELAVTGGTAAGNGQDYLLATQSLVFGYGEYRKTITLEIVDDSLDEVRETVKLFLVNPEYVLVGQQSSHTLTIEDNDPPSTVTFATAVRTVSEDAGSLAVHLFLSGPSGLPVTVPFKLSGTAECGADYRFGGPGVASLTIPPGQTVDSIVLAILDDERWEGPYETIVLTLGEPVNGRVGTLDECRVIVAEDDQEPRIEQVYPNPASRVGTDRVWFKGFGAGTLEVFNLDGQRVYTTRNGQRANDVFYLSWPVSPARVTAGTYLYKIEYETSIEAGKILINP